MFATRHRVGALIRARVPAVVLRFTRCERERGPPAAPMLPPHQTRLRVTVATPHYCAAAAGGSDGGARRPAARRPFAGRHNKKAHGGNRSSDVKGWLALLCKRTRPPMAEWAQLITACSKARVGGTGTRFLGADVVTAWAAIDAMRAAGLEPNVVVWTALITTCSRAKVGKRGGADVDGAWLAVGAMRAAGTEPNVFTWNSVIDACAKAKVGQHGGADVAGAWRALDAMRETGVRPDERTHDAVVAACNGANYAPHDAAAAAALQHMTAWLDGSAAR